MSRILLLGAGGNAGINFTKCVKNRHFVIGADMNNYYLASCNADIKVKVDYDNKLQSILDIVEEYDIAMIHAQPDPEVKWLLSQPELEKYIFPHSLKVWERFTNKLQCQATWAKDIKDFQVCSYKDAYMYPVLFGEMMRKGNGKVWVRAIQGAGSKAALPVTTMEQAQNWVSYWREARGMLETDFMFCQFLPGKEYAVQTLWNNGVLIQSQARERVAYFFGALMPSGQTSTPSVAKTVDNKDVYEVAYKAIQAIDAAPHGIYCVDLKEDMDNFPIPMEVNYGRFFTTSDFFAALGVNGPMEYINMFIKEIPITERIEDIQSEWYWIRGLDKEPKLLHKLDL